MPAWAEIESLYVDDSGTVSLNWVSSEQESHTLALEGRDGGSQSWRPLGTWNLTNKGLAPAKMHLETEPGSTCAEYRVLTFSSSGFLTEQRLGPAALGYSL